MYFFFGLNTQEVLKVLSKILAGEKLSLQNHGNSNCLKNMQTIVGNFYPFHLPKLSVMGFFLSHRFIILTTVIVLQNQTGAKESNVSKLQDIKFWREGTHCEIKRLRAREIRHSAVGTVPTRVFSKLESMGFLNSPHRVRRSLF